MVTTPYFDRVLVVASSLVPQVATPNSSAVQCSADPQMPSRSLSSSPPQPQSQSQSQIKISAANHRLLMIAAASSALAAAFLLLILLYLYLSLRRRRRRSPTLPLDVPSPPPHSPPLRRFSHRQLRLATASFSPSRLLGRGASASVFRALLPSGKSLAVKSLAASASDLDFRNELQILSSIPASPHIVGLVGYCEHRDLRFLVYEYMPNGSLQESLFGSEMLLSWEQRFRIILDVACGLHFLHFDCDPPVVHGDIKPSNVLLGSEFRAKIADFGLARVLKAATAATDGDDDFMSQDLGLFPSPQIDFEFARVNNSSHRVMRCNPIASLEDDSRAAAAAAKGKETPPSNLNLDVDVDVDVDDNNNNNSYSVENSKELINEGDWWWKQEGSGELNSRDYVREWIGSQICPPTNPDWEINDKSTFDALAAAAAAAKTKNDDDDDSCSGGKKSGSVKEWWKEEYFVEMSKKSKCNNKAGAGLKWFLRKSQNHNHNSSHAINLDVSFPTKSSWKKIRKKRSKSVGSEMFSGDIFTSRELSSTATSMRGTICYVAPEHCGGSGQLLEKADIYSFGVVILVIVSGRRPLHVLSSPMKLERANLISWCRQLASSGNVLDLVDERLRGSFDRDQANLCISLALSCLQKTPESRPDSAEIVKILKGEMEVPVVPFEFSPSPNSRRKSRSRRKTKTTCDPE